MRGRPLFASALVLAALAAVSGAGGSSTLVPPCSGAQLRGTFVYIYGSGAAGHVSYALQLRNVSSRACALSGLPHARLLDRRRRALPTQVVAAQPGATAARVLLSGTRRARANARFSPDVPGPGEPTTRPCERTAYGLRVLPGGRGAVVVPIRPVTSVCEHGRLEFSVFKPR
jgi:hypothetical protein